VLWDPLLLYFKVERPMATLTIRNIDAAVKEALAPARGPAWPVDGSRGADDP
jgi:hypothetical protein